MSSLRLLVASAKNDKIYEYPVFEPVGMKAGLFYRLTKGDLIKLPKGSQLFSLPNRSPVGYAPKINDFVTLTGLRAVAAFPSPGHTLTHSAAYKEEGTPKPLPLFSYGACAAYKGRFYTTTIQIDNDKRHDQTLMDPGLIRKNIVKFRKLFPKNRLISHLTDCATIYGCPNAQNLFLQRYEAPLPVSPSCNAACLGCISYQKGRIKCSQPRIRFVPRPEEIAQIAVFHIKNVHNPIVSFGQGCEGEPLLQRKTIEASIRIIRKETTAGTINMNSNGSMPLAVGRLRDAGLDSVRVSMNSSRGIYYRRYYSPKGYSFKDVLQFIRRAKTEGLFVSLNYLSLPGFTDSKDELAALERLIAKYRVDMIQWRNLNYDPLLYSRKLKIAVAQSELIGVREAIGSLRKEFPRLKMGYFNPFIPRAAASPRQ